jgi:hypothetical protein
MKSLDSYNEHIVAQEDMLSFYLRMILADSERYAGVVSEGGYRSVDGGYSDKRWILYSTIRRHRFYI